MASSHQNVDDFAERSGIDIDILQELYYNPQINAEPHEIKAETVEGGLTGSERNSEKIEESPPVRVKEEVIEHVRTSLDGDNKEQTIEAKTRPKRQVILKSKSYYNLRGRSSQAPDSQSLRTAIWTNKRLGDDCFRDRALTKVNLDEYHASIGQRNEYTEKLLNLSKISLRTQLDKFTYRSRKFIIATWLSVVRIFEYNTDTAQYFEVKRLPQRYFDLHSNLVTSVHYNNEKIYIAYMTDQPKKASVEIRDLKSKLLDSPYHYDEIVERIQSTCDFILIKTADNVIHVHRKNHFRFAPKCIDLNGITSNYVLSASAQITRTSVYTRFDVFVLTTRQFLILNSDGLRTKVAQNYDLDQRFETVSAHDIGDLIVLHRNLIDPCDGGKYVSNLEIGKLGRFKSHNYFVHERTISYEKRIIQVELGHNDTIFLLRQVPESTYEICCLSTSNFAPLWTHRVVDDELADDAKMVVHDNHVVIYSHRNQKISCVGIEGNIFNDCPSLQDAEIRLNVNMI